MLRLHNILFNNRLNSYYSLNSVLIVHIERAIYQIVCQLESIQSMVIQVYRIRHAAHEVHLGHDLSKKDYLVLILVQDQCDQHRHERAQMFQRIVYGPVQWIVIRQMIQKRVKGSNKEITFYLSPNIVRFES